MKTHPGVGPLTGLAYVLVIGTPDRFPSGKNIGSYTGSFPVSTPVPAINGWDISVSKVTRCCVTCWEKQRKQPHGVTRTGDVGICT